MALAMSDMAFARLQRKRSCLSAVRECGIPLGDDVLVYASARRARFGLVKRCASVWACRRCSLVKSAVRSAEIALLVERALAAGCGVAFVTLTIPHLRTDLLEDELDLMARAWRAFQRSRGADWDCVVGYVRSVEATWSRAYGWHAHYHALVIFDSFASMVEAGEGFRAGWVRILVREMALNEDEADQVERHGLRFDPVLEQNGLAEYVSKISLGMELASSETKSARLRSLTPGDLMARGWLELYHEYERATKGRRKVEWSRGLRDRFGVVRTRDDSDELAEDERCVGSVPKVLYRCMQNDDELAHRFLLAVLDRRAELEVVASFNGVHAASRVLLSLYLAACDDG